MQDRNLIPLLERFETPYYFYDMELLERTVSACRTALDRYGYLAHFALKANAERRILDRMREAGFGADCVSGNEVSLALRCGFDPGGIVFAGVGKTDREIRTALAGGIFCFNCESLPELEVIGALADAAGLRARVAFRVNPDIDAHTHEYISTGLKENKFGISPRDFEAALALVARTPSLELIGLHFHIGSQITDPEVARTLCRRVNEIQAWFSDRNVSLPHLNLGGGLGVDYDHPDRNPVPDFAAYFDRVHRYLHPLPGQRIHFEPGRSLVAQCGSLIARVLYVKEGRETRFLILDAGMNDLIRPALYRARHRIENLSARLRAEVPARPAPLAAVPTGESGWDDDPASGLLAYEVVGPVCESSDRWEHRAMLPRSVRGDLMAIHSAGAYGQVMGMRYNQRDLAPARYSDELAEPDGTMK